MATQSGITIDGPDKPYTIVSNIPRPTPGPKQALVKCLAVGLNPVEPLQQHTGLLITEWPAVIGSDFVGAVLEVGPECARLRPGDTVYGCAPLGQNRFAPFQETFLVEEGVVLKKGDNISIEEAATVGAGLLTAGLCLLAGAGLKLSDDGTRAPEKDEWVVVFGGAGTVGQFAVQIAHACGYKVLASCSPSKDSIALKSGATATFNNRATVDDQLAQIKKVTGGNFARMIDTTAYGYDIMVKALETCSTAATKYLTSVDDWSPFNTPSAINEYRASLGHLCRLDESTGAQVTQDIAGWISTFEAHLGTGTLRPIEYQLFDGIGWESVIKGIQELESGKAAKKIVVRTQAE
ncbi:b4b43796-8b17-4402-b827-cc67fd36ed47 [Thermothielavioides terrestris]|uniref:B4b43796-8b17-4402-b827-cc67fd36ed47 n=1 Tax=Thermothielavioides terrestris TaxID=2587410 RepID=A0A446B7F2_9PEZI|nr:b4b43796-8b17-4402-b827-cc67fd36ed47 [Thermothielavioides terrestris]